MAGGFFPIHYRIIISQFPIHHRKTTFSQAKYKFAKEFHVTKIKQVLPSSNTSLSPILKLKGKC